MPRMTRPAKPKKLNSSIGGTPTRKIGSSGNKSKVSGSRDRIGDFTPPANDGLTCTAEAMAGNRGGIGCGSLRKLQGCPRVTYFGAQLVDQLEALGGLDMPEGPAVAGARALRHRADAVGRADLVAQHDGAVGANQGAVALPGIDQFGAGRNHAALDQLGKRHPRRVARGHEWRQRRFRQRFDGGDAGFRRARIGPIALEADVTAAETP